MIKLNYKIRFSKVWRLCSNFAFKIKKKYQLKNIVGSVVREVKLKELQADEFKLSKNT